VGFYGHDASLNTADNYALRQSINKDNKPDKNDATSSWNVYWKVYGNLQKSIFDESVEVEEL
jgi:hypothetical protein